MRDAEADVPSRFPDAETLIETLQSEDRSAVIGAARVLSLWEDERKVQPLLQLLRSDDWEMRDAAASGLARHPEAEVAEALLDRVRHDDRSEVRATCLQSLGTDSRQGRQAHQAALRDPSPDLRAAAVPIWGGWSWRRQLRQMLSDPAPKVRMHVCRLLLILEAGGPDVVQALESLAGDPEAAEHDSRTELMRRELEERVASGDGLASRVLEILPASYDEMLADARRQAARPRGLRRLFRRGRRGGDV